MRKTLFYLVFRRLRILEYKLLVDEMLEFLAGKSVQIRDLFRLGKSNRSFSNSSQTRPRPILIKLAVAWDRKLILLRKRNLKNFKVKHLFVREDLPIERRHKSVVDSKASAKDTHPPIPSAPIDASCTGPCTDSVESTSKHFVSLSNYRSSSPQSSKSDPDSSLLSRHSLGRSSSVESASSSSSSSTLVQGDQTHSA